MAAGVYAVRSSLPAPVSEIRAQSTILPPSGRAGTEASHGRVVCSVEEYLRALMGNERGAVMQDPNMIGDTAPTLADDLRWTCPAEAS